MEISGVVMRVELDTNAKAISGAEGFIVIGLLGAVRVMVATKPVDFHQGAEVLATLVREAMGADPFFGAV